MKAVFFEEINDRLVQVDQRDIPNNNGRYWKIQVIEPIKAFVHQSEGPTSKCSLNKEKIYRMVTTDSGKFPAIFILEKLL